jgi:2-oxoglutarate dehydrogenase E1 component
MARGQVTVEPATASEKREAIFDAYRRWGFLQADLDPLGDLQPVAMAELDVDGKDAADARAIYCRSIGAEFMHIADRDRRNWIAQRMESESPAPDRARILERIVRAEIFEQVLQTRYLGTKRYSLEGNASLIPLLDEMLAAAADLGAEQGVIAMSHRGRLNVMVHIVGRQAAEVFARFEDVDPRSVLGSGDVKYHLGATGEFVTPGGQSLSMHLVSNPSHLEAVDPVAIGRARAKQMRIGAERGAARHSDSSPRRCRVCRPGHLGRDSELCLARRLHGRRVNSHHREQSHRIHHCSK